MPTHFNPGVLFWLPPCGPDWAAELATTLAKDPSGRQLRGICSAQLDTPKLRMVKNTISNAAGASLDALRPIRLGILGSGTMDFLTDVIPGTAPRFGMLIDVAPVAYNAIATPPFGTLGLEGPLDALAILPDPLGFPQPSQLLDPAAHDDAVDRARARIVQLGNAARQAFGCAVLVATMAPDPEQAAAISERAVLGSYSRFVADLNHAIISLAAEQGFALWDLEAVAASVGTRVWCDPISRHVAKSPFAISLAPLLADRLCAALAPLFGKSRRALVMDLDNTLWSGVIGDDGLSGINIGQGDITGEAHLAVQRYALELRQRGIVLCVCSKNDDAIAREPFREHPDMLLREEHFAVFQANWADKATNIRSIADMLVLDVDSLVFLDDNPAERARIRQIYPETAVPELPDDAAYFVSCLASAGYFETGILGEDDLKRAASYQANAQRAEIKQSVGSYDEYLESLGMTLTVRSFDGIGRSRIAQLINKSNQFNLTTRRRQEAEIEAIEQSPNHIGLQFRLADTFADNGMISVIVLEREGRDMIVDTWLMSCRVLERGVEKAVLNEIVRVARQSGAQRIVGEYIPTPRNSMVSDLYERLGFTFFEAGSTERATRWELAVATFEPFPVKIHVA